MDDEDLAFVTECENVAKEATDGPWILDRSGSFSAILADVPVINRGETQMARRQVSSWGGIKSEGDARFAVRARMGMPKLCAMVREQNKRARHAEQERDALGARIDELEKQVQELTKAASSWDPVAVAKLKTKNIELEAELSLTKEERDAVLEECDGCERLAHLTPTHVPAIRTDRGSKWLCGLCLLSSFRALETQLANRKSMLTRKDIALVLLRSIGPNPAEFMAMGKDAFSSLADRLIEMFDNESKVGKDKP